MYFITYKESIESNILALLMGKERLNEFIKTLDYSNSEEIFKEYNIDLSLLENIIERNVDQNGKLSLEWGKTKAA